MPRRPRSSSDSRSDRRAVGSRSDRQGTGSRSDRRATNSCSDRRAIGSRSDRRATGSRSTTERGALGESRAIECLRERGYRIVAKNFRCKMGEIDIIARHGQTLVFIEVRTRSSARFGRASETVNRAKQRQIARVAQFYITSRRPRFDTCRFDVVDITAGDVAVLQDAFRIDGAF